MNETPPELLIEGFRQLGSISAVLGGLAFASAAALLAVGAGTKDPRALDRPATLTAGAAVASAACLIVAALTWALLTVHATRAAATGQLVSGPLLVALNRPASLGFIAGVILLFLSMGASGWIASRALGIATTVIGILAGLAALFVISQFIS